MRTPWKAFEHRLRNQWPVNRTQTAYIRFQPTEFNMKPSRFDEAIQDFRRQQESIFQTPYLDIIGE